MVKGTGRSINLTWLFFRKLEHLEEIHVNMERAYKLHTESPPGPSCFEAVVLTTVPLSPLELHLNVFQAWKAECLKCPTILRPTAATSDTLLWAKRPSLTASWWVWVTHGRLGSPPSLMALIMFLALSRSSTWTALFGRPHVWSISSNTTAMQNVLQQAVDVKSCSFGNTVSVMWWQLGISYFGSSTLRWWHNPVLSTTDNVWSSRSMKWVSFTARGLSHLSRDIFSRFSSVCCKVGWCSFPLLALSYSLNSALCLFFRCFIKLLELNALFFTPLDNLAKHSLQSLLLSLLILKYLQTADIAALRIPALRTVSDQYLNTVSMLP